MTFYVNLVELHCIALNECEGQLVINLWTGCRKCKPGLQHGEVGWALKLCI